MRMEEDTPDFSGSIFHGVFTADFVRKLALHMPYS
jgi:hypothetical protein